MRTTLIIPDELMKSLMEETGETSKTTLVCRALEELRQKVRRNGLKSLRGKLDLELDLETLRSKDIT
jgi:hypothetical protein